MLKKTIITFCILITVTAVSFADNTKNLINSSHTGAINIIAYSELGNLLVSGGEDGVIDIWNPSQKKLEYQLQVSNMPVRKISVCKTKPYLAAVTGDGINVVDISVWNWKTGQMLFSNRLAEFPIFIDYSPKGSFIVYGKTDWDSLVFLDGETGRIKKPIKEGFGIVSSVYITKTEKTLLTYNSSGSIQYWDLTNGERKTKIPTTANLDKTSFSSNGRYMAGYTGSKILLIDLLSGKEIDSISAKNAVVSNIDSKTDNLVFCTSSRAQINITTLSFSGNGFETIDDSSTRNLQLPSVLLSYSGTIFSADNSGNIYKKLLQDDKLSLFAENNLLKIDDFALTEQFFTATGNGKIFSIPSIIFKAENKKNLSSYPDEVVLNIDPEASYGISLGKNDELLLWEKTCKDVAGISTIDLVSEKITKLTEIPSPLISAKYKNGRILTLDKNGECRILDYNDGKEEFKYSSFGIRTVDFIDKNNIVAGRNTSKTINSPLININTVTGETVPIKDSNILILDLQYDELSRKLYTLGFEKRNGLMRTVLKQHTGNKLEKVSTLMAYYGEDAESSFLPDLKSTKVFTSIGQSGIQMLYWGGFTPLEKSFAIPKKICLNSNIIASLNKDSSFCIYDQTTGNKLMDLYIFKDLSWLVFFKDGSHFASKEAGKYLN